MKMMLRVMAMLLILGGFAISPKGAAGQDKPEVAAQKVDEGWLALTDAGKYAESWNGASARFKAGVTEDKWKSAMEKYREPLGAVKSRTLSSATYSKTLPGLPDGNYVLIHFTTSFEHKQAAVETVVSEMEKDGSWRPSGYFIK